MTTLGEAAVMRFPISRAVRFRLLVLVAVVGAGLSACSRRDSAPPTEPVPAPVERTALPADIEAQVHAFCGASCHPYPPAEAFPKSHWRMEVERGFRFFDKSGLSLNPPKLGHV